MTQRKYLVLAVIVLLGAFGDVMLGRGMKDMGAISLDNWTHAISALANPWVATGTVLLIGFLSGYMNALSWADLTYVLPTTSVGYVVIALLSRFTLGEHISPARWLGILLITGGVGFVAGGPSHTPEHERNKIATREQ